MIPQITLEQFETGCQDRHLLHTALDYWAQRKPDEAVVINATRGTHLTWAQLRDGSIALARSLWTLGLRKGDYLAASLPLLNEHLLLEYACFRLGVIHVPLDLRLQPADVLRSLTAVSAKAFAFLGKTPAVDFSALGEAARRHVEHLIQFAPPEECIPGAISFGALLSRGSAGELPPTDINEHDGAQVIFTTGSTGSPKAALLSHRSITCQNLCLGSAFGFGTGQRVLCNLPASHVGGQAELLLTSIFMGGTAVTLEIFDPVKSLEAIEQHGVTLIGQIPAMFNMEWRTSGYDSRDFSRLRAAVYGGQAVPRQFLERMLQMAPAIGTGLGLTEASGFCTYTDLTPDPAVVARSIGWAMPAYRMTIRREMSGNTAGAELSEGEIGHVCFSGPQTFLGYVNDPEATARTISSDGWLYTGDMGYIDHDGLHFSGRAKWIIKPSGYQVFPGDVENHISELTAQVSNVGVVGHEHRVWSEGIIAFVEKRPGAEITDAELRKHSRALTSYMRPLHYVVLDHGSMPLNRTAKVDIVKLQELAKQEVAALRERGRWDGDAQPGAESA